MLGELLEAAGPDTTVLLLSDHGFHSDHLRPVIRDIDPHDRAALESSWHRMYGVFVAAGPGFRKGVRIAAPSVLDLAPTALVALGLPIGRDMDGRPVLEAFEGSERLAADLATVESWESIDGPDGRHPPELRQDPFEARDALKQLVELGYLAPLGDDQEALLGLVRRETDFNLAMVYLGTDRPAEAIAPLARLVAERPDEPRYVLSLAKCQMQAMRAADAIATLDRYLAARPDDTDGRIMRAAALAAAGRTDEARAAIRELARKLVSRPELARTLGDLYASVDLWNEAIAAYERAIAREKGNPSLLLALARALLGAGRFEPAAEKCLEAMEIQQALPEGHLLLGVALAWLEMPEPAIQSLGFALRLQPGLLEAHRMLAALHRERGEAEPAARHAAEAAKGGDAPEMPRGASAWSRR